MDMILTSLTVAIIFIAILVLAGTIAIWFLRIIKLASDNLSHDLLDLDHHNDN